MKRMYWMSATAMLMAGCASEPEPIWVTVTDYMAIGREGLSLSSTDDGAIVTGGNLGFEGVINFAEEFDPITKKWTPLPDVRGIVTSCGEVQRQDHRATRMPDGRILITGGRFMASGTSTTKRCACAHNETDCSAAYSNTYVVYDPNEERIDNCHGDTDTDVCTSHTFPLWSEGWSPAKDLRQEHALHTVTLLSNDLEEVAVLLIGGPGETLKATAEILEYRNDSKGCLIFDDNAVLEATQAPAKELMTGHSATPIGDNDDHVTRVLVFGGTITVEDKSGSGMVEVVVTENHAQIVDILPNHKIGPDYGKKFTPIKGEVPPPRVGHIAEKLSSNRILIAGGWDTGKTPLADAWIFDGQRFVRTGSMNHPHAFSASVVNGDEVFVSGGFSAFGTPSQFVERYDAKSGTWAMLPAMNQQRARHAMLRLPGYGLRFLVTGGASSEDKVVRTGEILFMNDRCEAQSDCSPGRQCDENSHCVEP